MSKKKSENKKTKPKATKSKKKDTTKSKAKEKEQEEEKKKPTRKSTWKPKALRIKKEVPKKKKAKKPTKKVPKKSDKQTKKENTRRASGLIGYTKVKVFVWEQVKGDGVFTHYSGENLRNLVSQVYEKCKSEGGCKDKEALLYWIAFFLDKREDSGESSKDKKQDLSNKTEAKPFWDLINIFTTDLLGQFPNTTVHLQQLTTKKVKTIEIKEFREWYEKNPSGLYASVFKEWIDWCNMIRNDSSDTEVSSDDNLFYFYTALCFNEDEHKYHVEIRLCDGLREDNSFGYVPNDDELHYVDEYMSFLEPMSVLPDMCKGKVPKAFPEPPPEPEPKEKEPAKGKEEKSKKKEDKEPAKEKDSETKKISLIKLKIETYQQALESKKIMLEMAEKLKKTEQMEKYFLEMVEIEEKIKGLTSKI